MQKARYLFDRLTTECGIKPHSSAPFFNEYTLDAGDKADALFDALRKAGIYGGVRIGQFDSRYAGLFTVAVTEKRTRAEMDRYVEVAKGVTA
jgi:glycine dehydrogenase subunit 1